METTWVVQRVTEKPGLVEAELVRVEWYRRNPEYDVQMAAYGAVVDAKGEEEADRQFADVPFIDEFIEAEPSDEGAQYNEGNGTMTLDLTDSDLELHPLDAVTVTVAVVETVDA